MPASKGPGNCSVVITSANRAHVLEGTCEHLADLEPPPSEVIVYLDGCTDNSKEILRRRFPEYRVVENAERRGSIPSRDEAFRLAQGAIIISLDDDSYPADRDFITRVQEAFARHPEAAVIAFQELRKCTQGGYEILPKWRMGCYISDYANCAAAYRASLYGTVAAFPSWFSHLYEEPDYCVQSYASGYGVWFEPTVRVIHEFTSIERNMLNRHHLNARNELLSVLLRCPAPQVVGVALYRVLRQALFAARQGPSWLLREPVWWLSALRLLANTLHERRAVDWRCYWSWMRMARRPVIDINDLQERFGRQFYSRERADGETATAPR